MKREMFLENEIHETVIIGADVIIGRGNYIGPYSVITGNTVIGDNNRFESHVSIGTPPEHRNHFEDPGAGVIIGNGCVIREFVTINSGTEVRTTLGNGVVMLRGSHVGHDCQVGDWVNLSCNVMLGGHSDVGEGANFGLGSMCHQYSVIGGYAMIGMGSVVTKSCSIQPGNTYVGTPARFLSANTIGLERAGITQDQLAKLTIDWIYCGGQENIK